MNLRSKLKRTFLALAVCSAALGVSVQAAEAEPIPLRGVVEGFYGTPWKQADRMDIIKFCAEHGMNAYIYAPKDDPYHRDKWREPYPTGELNKLKRLALSARKQNVRFIFAISPGLDIHFGGVAAYRDRDYMIKKLTALYDAGVRDFAIFFDDIKDKSGKEQAEFLNWISREFVHTHRDVSPLITVPTEYFLEDMEENGLRKTYTKAFSETLDRDVLVLYTGNRVVGDSLSDEDYQKGSSLYQRALGIWWNYPVTDYMEAKLALGPIEKLPTHAAIPAVFFNPMKYERLSKISLATGADYAKEPKDYDPTKSWQKNIRAQYGRLATDMMRFADQSQEMDNHSWAKCGPADGTELHAKMDAFWAAWKGRQDISPSASALDRNLAALERSCKRLQDELPNRTLKECLPQLQQLQRIAAADRAGLKLLCDTRSGKTVRKSERKAFAEQCREVRAHDKKAVIAEKTARALLDHIEAELK